MMRNTSKASQTSPYTAGQRLEKSISLPTKAMCAENDMNHRFNYEKPEHPAKPKAKKASEMPLPRNAMHAPNEMNHWFNYEIPEHPTKPKTKEASQIPHYMAGQRLEKSISLPTDAMHAQNDMNHRFNYKMPEHPAIPKTNKASQMPHYMEGQRSEKSVLMRNAMHAPDEMDYWFEIPEHPMKPDTKEASQIPNYVAGQRFEKSISLPRNAMDAQNDMNHWCNYEIPELSMKLKTKSSTSKARPKMKSSRMYLLSCGSESDIKRQKRLAGYYVYAAEGRLKASMRNTFSWFKDKYHTIVHGY